MNRATEETAPAAAGGHYYEYTEAVDPVGAGILPKLPAARFTAALYADARSHCVPLDCSQALQAPYPCTSPALLAQFLRVVPEVPLALPGPGASELYFVLRGRGEIRGATHTVPYAGGDFLVWPGGQKELRAHEDSVLYCVDDAPLCAHLGVQARADARAPTRFVAAEARQALRAVAARPQASKANRISVVVVDAAHAATRSASAILWSMLGVLPRGAEQAPHRHQSVALDLIVDCGPGCYSLMGKKVDDHGRIVDGQRIDWEPGMAFVTPPGLWHSHHNEGPADATLVPVQDAGLHSYLRSLDIRFRAFT